MKPLLPLLLTYVMMTSQTFAISGGPVFSNGSAFIPGTYSGVLQGVSEDNDVSTGPEIPGDPIGPVDPSAATPSNAIGLFDLAVPQIGLATGTFLLFSNGVVFGGMIDASADVDSGEIRGVLQGTYDLELSTFDGTGALVTVQVTATALGRIDAQVTNTTSLFASSLARLIGTANLAINFGEYDVNTLEPIVSRTITFDVVGFKQANL